MPNENIVLKFKSLKVNVPLSNCIGLEMNYNYMVLLVITQPCLEEGENTENI